ncbi:MAG: ABC transporter permease, partial [Gammaproteobacteria bacterium]|nr:ABC transporter permease [Gammaproteobacteria bacterium]
MMILNVALASLLNRKLTVLLTTLTIAVSVFVLLGVEHIRSEARQSFTKTVSGVDLIVGPRTG